MDMITFF